MTFPLPALKSIKHLYKLLPGEHLCHLGFDPGL